jgi:FHS family L-fucose permease-like MFS transporter
LPYFYCWVNIEEYAQKPDSLDSMRMLYVFWRWFVLSSRCFIPILKITVRKSDPTFETANKIDEDIDCYREFSCNFLPISFPVMKTLNSLRFLENKEKKRFRISNRYNTFGIGLLFALIQRKKILKDGAP